MPAIVSVAALILFYVLLEPAGDYFQDYTDSWWLYSGDAGTARDLPDFAGAPSGLRSRQR